ncbi:hypothetical protein RclHR1_16340002 [Rhizophagus clarus]|uniref:Uncharacterized protein n=1 Tax=Rhizophagus clarus TaxID=94130 RepID=A0A2Z6RA62_9GLOM|nr:hypothetical protein RclHR1_16340002 [Rhizophagus clarus]GES96291.1 hypothetical protein GLOIN_2v1582196 [Rhizophagus clarus]
MFVRISFITLIISFLIEISVSSPYRQYPVHNVSYHYRGYTYDLADTCVNFLDWQQNAYKICYESNIADNDIYDGELTSPDWSIGYQLCTKLQNFPHDNVLCTDNVLWWDGWVGQKYCNDMHIHLKGLDDDLSWSYNIINGNDYCSYP